MSAAERTKPDGGLVGIETLEGLLAQLRIEEYKEVGEVWTVELGSEADETSIGRGLTPKHIAAAMAHTGANHKAWELAYTYHEDGSGRKIPNDYPKTRVVILTKI